MEEVVEIPETLIISLFKISWGSVSLHSMVSDFLRSNTTPEVTVSFTENEFTVLPLIFETAIFAPLPLSPLFLITSVSPVL